MFCHRLSRRGCGWLEPAGACNSCRTGAAMWVWSLKSAADNADVTKQGPPSPVSSSGDGRGRHPGPTAVPARHRASESDTVDQLHDTVAIRSGASRYGRHAAPTADLPRAMPVQPPPGGHGALAGADDVCEAEPDVGSGVGVPGADDHKRPTGVASPVPHSGGSPRILEVLLGWLRPSTREVPRSTGELPVQPPDIGGEPRRA